MRSSPEYQAKTWDSAGDNLDLAATGGAMVMPTAANTLVYFRILQGRSDEGLSSYFNAYEKFPDAALLEESTEFYTYPQGTELSFDLSKYSVYLPHSNTNRTIATWLLGIYDQDGTGQCLLQGGTDPLVVRSMLSGESVTVENIAADANHEACDTTAKHAFDALRTSLYPYRSDPNQINYRPTTWNAAPTCANDDPNAPDPAGSRCFTGVGNAPAKWHAEITPPFSDLERNSPDNNTCSNFKNCACDFSGGDCVFDGTSSRYDKYTWELMTPSTDPEDPSLTLPFELRYTPTYLEADYPLSSESQCNAMCALESMSTCAKREGCTWNENSAGCVGSRPKRYRNLVLHRNTTLPNHFKPTPYTCDGSACCGNGMENTGTCECHDGFAGLSCEVRLSDMRCGETFFGFIPPFYVDFALPWSEDDAIGRAFIKIRSFDSVILSGLQMVSLGPVPDKARPATTPESQLIDQSAGVFSDEAYAKWVMNMGQMVAANITLRLG